MKYITPLILSIIISMCSSDNNATVKIHLNSQNAAHNKIHNSMLNQLLSFFVTPAHAQQAPSDISQYRIRVSGSDISTIVYEFGPSTNVAIIAVPAGSNRRIEVFADLHSNSAIPVYTFRGSESVSINAGDSKTITPVMKPYFVKLLFPDLLNNRLVIMDDFSGAGWRTRINSEIGFVFTLSPYDVKIDGRGRIYIANNGFSTGEDVVIRMDDINGTNLISFGSSGSAVRSIAIDHDNHLLYRANGINQVYRSNLDGTNSTLLTTTGITNIRGMELDSNGILFIAASNNLIAYDPGTETVLDVFTITGEVPEFWDIIIKDENIYVSFDETGTAGNLFLFRFNNNTITPISNYSTNLAGPHRLIKNFGDNRIIFSDELSTNERLILLENIDGDGRRTFGSNGTGVNQFNGFE